MKLITLCSLIMSLILVFAPGGAYSQTEPAPSDPPVKVEPQPDQPSESAPVKSSSEISTPAVESPKSDLSNTVPKLNITWECTDCTKNEKIIPLIEKNYSEEAMKNGKTVSETDIADIAITDFRQRPPGVRVMFGIMAGKDRLALRIRYKGAEFKVDDYSANAITGMNLICSSLAKKIYTELVR